MLFEMVLVFLLILINGFFASAEIAVIAARKSNIKNLAEKGNRSASVVHQFQNNPEPFLATVQIGVTLIGAAAAAVGGATAVESIKPFFDNVPFLEPFGAFISVSIVVLVISYFSLVFGELIPKALAIKHPEPIAMAMSQLCTIDLPGDSGT